MTERVQIFTREGDVCFCVGIERGYYQERGIEAELQSKRDSATNTNLVASTPSSFGMVDCSHVLMSRSEALPVKAVSLMAAGVLAIVSFADSNIKHPRDLEGKTLGLAKGGGEFSSLPLLASNAGLDLDKVRTIDFQPGKGDRALLSGQIDAYGGYYTGSIQDVIIAGREMGRATNVIRYSDYGVNLYNAALVANEGFLASKRGAATDFVTQTLRAFAWAIDNQVEAVGIYLKSHPDETEASARSRFASLARVILDLEETRSHGLGWMKEGGWNQLQEMMMSNRVLTKRLDTREAFTCDLISSKILPESAKQR